MTDSETIARLLRDVEGHGRRIAAIEIERAAESERWKMASADISEIKDELKEQGRRQRSAYLWLLTAITGPLIAALMAWIISGGLNG